MMRAFSQQARDLRFLPFLQTVRILRYLTMHILDTLSMQGVPHSFQRWRPLAICRASPGAEVRRLDV